MGVAAVFFAALFSGIPAIVLVWWTIRRDQERLVVQKLVWYGNKLGGGSVILRDDKGPMFHVLIRNRSLFPVHISAVGFEIDGLIVESKNPYFESSSGIPAGVQGNLGSVREVQSGDSVKVSIFDPKDRTELAVVLARAAKKHSSSEEDFLMGSKVAALVALESGRQFSSMSFGKKIWRKALQIKREMDGQPPSDEDTRF